MKINLGKVPLVALFFLVGAQAHAHVSVTCKVTYLLKSGENAEKHFFSTGFERKVLISENFEALGISAALDVESDTNRDGEGKLAVHYSHRPSGVMLSAKSISAGERRTASLVVSDPTFIHKEMARLSVDCAVTPAW